MLEELRGGPDDGGVRLVGDLGVLLALLTVIAEGAAGVVAHPQITTSVVAS